MSRNYQIALGEYRFKLNQSAYEELRRTTRYHWAKQDLIQTHPAYQAVGMGEDTIYLKGAVFNYQSNMNQLHIDQLQTLRSVAQMRKPLRMALENGINMGYWIIQSIEETQSYLIVDSPLKQSFNLQIAYYGEKA